MNAYIWLPLNHISLSVKVGHVKAVTFFFKKKEINGTEFTEYEHGVTDILSSFLYVEMKQILIITTNCKYNWVLSGSEMYCCSYK